MLAGTKALTSIIGMPNSSEAMRVSRALSTRLWSSSQAAKAALCWSESATALRTSASGSTSSETSLRAMPERPASDGCISVDIAILTQPPD